jgi:hypothetical protein
MKVSNLFRQQGATFISTSQAVEPSRPGSRGHSLATQLFLPAKLHGLQMAMHARAITLCACVVVCARARVCVCVSACVCLRAYINYFLGDAVVPRIPITCDENKTSRTRGAAIRISCLLKGRQSSYDEVRNNVMHTYRSFRRSHSP